MEEMDSLDKIIMSILYMMDNEIEYSMAIYDLRPRCFNYYNQAYRWRTVALTFDKLTHAFQYRCTAISTNNLISKLDELYGFDNVHNNSWISYIN